MPSALTLKDVLYALEYGRQTLCRFPRQGKPAIWVLEPNGTPVPQRIAEAATITADVVCIERLINGRQVFGWRMAA